MKEDTMELKNIKLETYIPESHLKDLQKALQEADAGHIGNYDRCMSYYRVSGTWRPLEGANPYIGTPGEISEEPEIKVEVTLKAEQMEDVVTAVRRVHPYEEPVINLIPLLHLEK